MRTGLLGLAVGLALADSSIVTLALPELLLELDLSITTVAWVLTSFNLVLALAAVPAAYAARRRPRGAFAAGTVAFAGASLACGLAPSFEVLLAGRCVQAVGAALLVTAALGLLSRTTADDARAARIWVAAGVLGAALGPAAGGILTELFGWEAIFLVQVPVALLPLAALGRPVGPAEVHAARPRRPHLLANLALLLLSGGLVAAFFLLVLLMVSGWGMSPAAAGAVATVMPAAAVVAARRAPADMDGRAHVAAGVVLAGGGLASLALLPRAGWAWTIPPQLLVGAGLGLALAPLTERGIAGEHARARVAHGGWALASRHAGVVLGLLLLAPVLTASLERNEELALRAGVAEVLDSRVPPLDKLRLAQDVLGEVDRAEREGELPDVARAFEDRPDDEEHRDLLAGLRDELHRAVTDAFSRPFLLAALLALGALGPVALVRGEP